MKQVTTSYKVQGLPETAVKKQAARYQALLAKLLRASENEIDTVLQAREEVAPEPELNSEIMQKVQAKIDEAQKR